MMITRNHLFVYLVHLVCFFSKAYCTYNRIDHDALAISQPTKHEAAHTKTSGFDSLQKRSVEEAQLLEQSRQPKVNLLLEYKDIDSLAPLAEIDNQKRNKNFVRFGKKSVSDFDAVENQSSEETLEDRADGGDDLQGDDYQAEHKRQNNGPAGKNFLRFGRNQGQQGPASKNFVRFGKSVDQKLSNNFVRFGRSVSPLPIAHHSHLISHFEKPRLVRDARFTDYNGEDSLDAFGNLRGQTDAQKASAYSEQQLRAAAILRNLIAQTLQRWMRLETEKRNQVNKNFLRFGRSSSRK